MFLTETHHIEPAISLTEGTDFLSDPGNIVDGGRNGEIYFHLTRRLPPITGLIGLAGSRSVQNPKIRFDRLGVDSAWDREPSRPYPDRNAPESRIARTFSQS